MANAANHVTLSTGQILFADPTSPWAPSNFPNLPSTSLALTAIGTIAGRNIEKLSFSNVIQYQNYENPSLRPALIKSLVTNSEGVVYYDDPKVSLVSTALTEYQLGITGFGSSNIGAPGILSSPPDTLTTAIAKIDGWISQLLLSQPPAVTYAETENTSLYAGTRWYNFNVYNTLGNSVPFVSGIVVMLGDPASGNYLTLELTNSALFPDRQFQDGLASDFYPLVRLRIFNEFFLSSADQLYSKAYMQTQCVKIIGEGGTYTLPSTGKVYAVEYSQSGLTYTTLSLYLPQLAVGTDIPVRIIYINKTQTSPNIYYTSTSTTTFGGPSAPQNIIQTMSTPNSFTLQVSPPVFSDATHSVSSCYFSSYNLNYTATQLNIAHNGDLGFRYGQAAPTPLPAYLSSYTNSTFTRITPVGNGATQEILVAGSGMSQVLPGLQWSTSIYATNSAMIIGSSIGGPTPVVSAFPITSTQCISSASLAITSPWAIPAGSNGGAYLNYSNGWSLGAPLSTNLAFVSTNATTAFNISGNIQFNDPSYPGCRSNMTFETIFKDVDDVPQTVSLTRTPVSNDFVLNSAVGAKVSNNYLSTVLVDSQNGPTNVKFFYDAQVSGGQSISSISQVPQSLQARFTNFRITGFDAPIETQILSTSVYAFTTEAFSTFNTSTITLPSTITSTVQISGIYTPTTQSDIYFDIHASNFISRVANFSSIAMAQVYYNNVEAGPLTRYTSSLRIKSDSTEITTLPFPGNTILTLSSLRAPLTSNIYQDPADPQSFAIKASVTPTNPIASRGLLNYDIGSELFVDTVSYPLYSTFSDRSQSNGLRVLSCLPRYESPGTTNDMNDGISASGLASNGLNVSISSFYILGLSNSLFVSSSVVYNNTSSISSIYTDPYSRELLFTNGAFTHPGGLNFTQFSGIPLGKPNAIFPDFINDLYADVNYGNRYASFLFTGPSNAAPRSYQYVNIRVRNPSALSTITNDRTYNFAFPDSPVPDANLQYSKVRMHMRVLAAYNNTHYSTINTEWINCFKPINYPTFDDSVFDVGGCVAVSTSGADVYYKVQMNRRYYTSIYPIVRVGISRDGSAEVLPAGSDYLPITFDGLTIEVSDS